MGKIYLHTIILVALTNTVWGQRNLVGQYSALGPHGKDIVLNADSTFEYHWHSDLPDTHGKREGVELRDSLTKWTTSNDMLVFKIPAKYQDRYTDDLKLEILSDNVIKRINSNQKWYKTKIFDDNGKLKIEYLNLEVDQNNDYLSYTYREHQGKRTTEYEFRNGVKQNSEMELFENDNGKKVITIWGEWDKGLKTGSWTYTNEDGQLTESQTWKGGKKNGEWKYYSNGQLTTIKIYKDGVLKSERKQ